MNLRNSVVIALLAAAAAASYWFGRKPPADPARDGFGGESALPGYRMTGARFTRTDDLGRVVYRVNAESLEELPNEQGLALSGVRVEYTPPDEVPWHISASRGTTPIDRSHLDLEEAVELRNAPADGEPPKMITAASLRFTPGESSVESDEAVEIRVGSWLFRAVGLRADLNDEKLALESRVHGQIVP